MNDPVFFIWYALRCGCRSVEGIRLLELYHNDPERIHITETEELAAHEEISEEFAAKLENRSTEDAERILADCFMNNIRVITCADDDYPERLKTLADRPIVLYVRGSIENLNQRLCISVVGTRSMTEYGKRATFNIVRGLCASGALIVSGAAYGIDSVANNTAVYLRAETIAVLGSGVNVPYPRENRKLLDAIAERGMVISEYPPGTPPNGRNFPVRNRIISGLSDSLLVVEAGAKSGALITAEYALEQKRTLYAVPGNIDAPNSYGTNGLLRQGARICTCADDIIGDYLDRFAVQMKLKRELPKKDE